MRLRLLGPVRADHDGRSVPLGPRRQRFVLGVLALEVNRLVPLDRLVDLAWQEPPRTARHAVRVCASGLRTAFAGIGTIAVTGGPSGYTLEADPDRVDVHRFRRLLARAESAPEDTDRIRLLDEALALWYGPPLVDCAAPEVRDRLCGGLLEAQLSALEDRAEAGLRLGRHGTLVAELTGLVAEHPVRGRLVGQLMLALHRTGRTAEALGVYRDTRRRLVDEFGLDPDEGLRRLQVTLLRGDPVLAAKR